MGVLLFGSTGKSGQWLRPNAGPSGVLRERTARHTDSAKRSCRQSSRQPFFSGQQNMRTRRTKGEYNCQPLQPPKNEQAQPNVRRNMPAHACLTHVHVCLSVSLKIQAGNKQAAACLPEPLPWTCPPGRRRTGWPAAARSRRSTSGSQPRPALT